MMDKINIQIKIRYITLIVTLLSTLIIALLYYYYYEENLEHTLAIIGSGIALTAVIYSAINTNLIYHIESGKFENEKKQVAMSFIEKWSQPEVSKLNSKASSTIIKIQDLNQEELKIFLTKNPDEQMAILNLLNFFENIAIAVNNNIADEDIMKSFYKEILCPNYSQLQNIISLIKKKNKGESYLLEYKVLVERWN